MADSLGAGLGLRKMGQRWTFPKFLQHLSVFGATGSGKSQTLKNCAEKAYLNGTKIFDLYSAAGNEAGYWGLESNHAFWEKTEFKYAQKRVGKREFPVKVLVPMSETLPRELPDIFEPFTIPINTITEEDIRALLGSTLTTSQIPLWRKIQKKIKKDTTFPDLLNWILDEQKEEKKNAGKGRIPGVDSRAISSIYNNLQSFEKSMLFSSANCPTALDLNKEIKDYKVITALELKWYPKRLWGFILNHFIHQIYDAKLNGVSKRPTVLMIREVGDFLVNVSEASPQEEAVKRNMVEVLRKGRRSQVFFFIDNQSPVNIDIVKTQCAIKIVHYVDRIAELEGALGDLGSMLLTRNDYATIQTFAPPKGRGRCFILEPRGLFMPKMLPPLSRMSGDEGADFIEIWRNEKGGKRFKNMLVLATPVREEYDKSYNDWNQKLKDRKTKKAETEFHTLLQRQIQKETKVIRPNPKRQKVAVPVDEPKSLEVKPVIRKEPEIFDFDF